MYTFSKTNDSIKKRVVTLPPGLLKIFDEILVNAIDNKQRDKSMNRIDVDITDSGSRISVRNNGKGIPIRPHKTENMYIPELIFGHLLTDSNFRDEGSIHRRPTRIRCEANKHILQRVYRGNVGRKDDVSSEME